MRKRTLILALMVVAAIAFCAQTIYAKPPAGAGSCGNGKCNGKETCSTCPQDCGECPPVCGNNSCEAGETCSTCSQDCGECPPACGNGSCESGETCSSCWEDCGSCPAECGNGLCEGGETTSTCPEDCGSANWSSLERIQTEELAWFDVESK